VLSGHRRGSADRDAYSEQRRSVADAVDPATLVEVRAWKRAKSSSRSLRRSPEANSPSAGSSRPSLCNMISSASSCQVVASEMSRASPRSMRSMSESWMRRKMATSFSEASRRSRPLLAKSIFTLCLSIRVWM